MKALVFICALIFTQVSSAEIKIVSFEGMHSVHFNGSDFKIILEKDFNEDFLISFYSTSTIGTPRITGVFTTEYAIPLKVTAYPLVAVNQITTLHTTANLMYAYSNEQIYKIGVDGDNDGKLDSVNDDYISVPVSTSPF